MKVKHWRPGRGVAALAVLAALALSFTSAWSAGPHVRSPHKIAPSHAALHRAPRQGPAVPPLIGLVSVSVDSGPDEQSETSVAVSPKNPNNLVCDYHDSRLPFAAPGIINVSRSTDGGGTWTVTGFGNIPAGSTGATFDPRMAFDNDGRFFAKGDQFATNTDESFRTLVGASTDNGNTFNPVVAFSLPADPNGFNLIDHGWIDTDRSTGANRGSIYLAASFVQNDANGNFLGQTMNFTRSTDHGQTWSNFSQGAIINDNGLTPNEADAIPTLATGPNGEVYVNWIQFTFAPEPQLIIASSFDGGVTFGKNVVVTTINNANIAGVGSTIRIGNQPNVCVDTSNGPNRGNVYVIYNDVDPNNANGTVSVFVTVSRDKGATWSTPQRVDSLNTDFQVIPSCGVNPETGDLLITYYSNRFDPNFPNLPADGSSPLVDLFAAVGHATANSLTFDTSVRVSTQSTDSSLGVFFTPQIGDYNGIAFRDFGQAGANAVLTYAQSDGQGIEIAAPVQFGSTANIASDGPPGNDFLFKAAGFSGSGAASAVWSFGDGSTSNQLSVDHQYSAAGNTFFPTCTVRDQASSVNNFSFSVFVPSLVNGLLGGAGGQPLINGNGVVGGGGGGGCFIATAAYGSSLDPHVSTLRAFRDSVLEHSAVGRALVRTYYQVSPPIANWIASREWARTAVRMVLWPAVAAIEYPVAAVLVAFLTVLGALAWRRRRLRPSVATAMLALGLVLMCGAPARADDGDKVAAATNHGKANHKSQTHTDPTFDAPQYELWLNAFPYTFRPANVSDIGAFGFDAKGEIGLWKRVRGSVEYHTGTGTGNGSSRNITATISDLEVRGKYLLETDPQNPFHDVYGWLGYRSFTFSASQVNVLGSSANFNGFGFGIEKEPSYAYEWSWYLSVGDYPSLNNAAFNLGSFTYDIGITKRLSGEHAVDMHHPGVFANLGLKGYSLNPTSNGTGSANVNGVEGGIIMNW